MSNTLILLQLAAINAMVPRGTPGGGKPIPLPHGGFSDWQYSYLTWQRMGNCSGTPIASGSSRARGRDVQWIQACAEWTNTKLIHYTPVLLFDIPSEGGG